MRKCRRYRSSQLNPSLKRRFEDIVKKSQYRDDYIKANIQKAMNEIFQEVLSPKCPSVTNNALESIENTIKSCIDSVQSTEYNKEDAGNLYRILRKHTVNEETRIKVLELLKLLDIPSLTSYSIDMLSNKMCSAEEDCYSNFIRLLKFIPNNTLRQELEREYEQKISTPSATPSDP